MRKSLVALAVAGALAAPIIAQADAFRYYPALVQVHNEPWRSKSPKKKKPATKPARARKSKRQAQRKAKRNNR